MVIDHFDSEILNLGVAKIIPSLQDTQSFFLQAEAFFFDQKIDLVFCEVPPDVQLGILLNEYGYYFVSSRITYRFQGVAAVPGSQTNGIRVTDQYHYCDDDIFLSDLAIDLSKASHYGKDPFIGPDGARNVYRAWIKNTFAGYAQKVLVATDEQGHGAGIVSLRVVEEDLAIDLLGVHSSFRSKGLGSLLVAHACYYAQQERRSLKVVTQVENISANRLYQKNNFLTESVSLVYHKVVTRREE